jgi:hypothetical protein
MPGCLRIRRLQEVLARLVFMLGSLVPWCPVAAGDLLELNVTDARGVYRIDAEVIVRAPFEQVWQVLTDYIHIYRLNDSIIESEILPSPVNNSVRVRTLMNDCVFVFCFEIERVEDVRITDTGHIKAIVVRELSNVRSGDASWRIRPAGTDTYIRYTGTIEPGFAVIPVVGNYLVRKQLRKQMMLTLDKIEHISQINAELGIKPEPGIMASTLP